MTAFFTSHIFQLYSDILADIFHSFLHVLFILGFLLCVVVCLLAFHLEKVPLWRQVYTNPTMLRMLFLDSLAMSTEIEQQVTSCMHCLLFLLSLYDTCLLLAVLFSSAEILSMYFLRLVHIVLLPKIPLGGEHICNIFSVLDNKSC